MFGKVLRSFIENKYDSLAKFADECKVSTGYLNDLLSGRTLPKNQKLQIIIDNLKPLSEADEKLLLREWAFDKSDGVLRKDFEEIENQNKNMLQVLNSVKKEKELLQEISELKEYETFYNLFFKELSTEETRTVLNSILKELKVIAMDKGKTNEFKEKFEQVEKMINSI